MLCQLCMDAGGVALVILAAIDAAYSGDWSRIGVISKDTEAWLQSALKALAAWHVVNAVAAYVIADKNSKATLPVTAKVLGDSCTIVQRTTSARACSQHAEHLACCRYLPLARFP